MEIPGLSSKARNGTEDCGLHHRHAVSHLLVVMDVLGPATSVTLCRTYRRIRWSAPVTQGDDNIPRLDQPRPNLNRDKPKPGRSNPQTETPPVAKPQEIASGFGRAVQGLVPGHAGVHVVHAKHGLNAVIHCYSNTEAVHTDIAGVKDARTLDTWINGTEPLHPRQCDRPPNRGVNN